MSKKAELEKELNHYKKVRNHWGRFDSTIKVAGVLLTLGTSIAVSVLIPLSVPVIVPTVLSAIAAANAGLTEGLVIGLTSRKKRVFRERFELIQSYLHKMFVYIEKCKGDNIVTIDELEGFHRLMNDYNTDMNRLKTVVDGNNHSKLEKQAHYEAKKEIRQELKTALKDREKSELRTLYAVS